ncbi:MAG: hypothetical protein EXS17_00155 [Phycisphaerales bacterium]|nr:hypothetical protein [Phycisphaerales bacterium]
MDRWAEVSRWAKANGAMGEALIAAQFASVFGLPYGTSGVDSKWVKAGIVISIAQGADVGRVQYGYFKAIEAIGAYATAEMYRRGEAGEFQEAFSVGIAYARLLRQLCEQTMLEEKLFALENLAENLSIHRDFMWSYLDKIPVGVLQNAALKEYTFLKPSDNEKLRRLQLPEGDRVIAETVLRNALTPESGETGLDPEKFASVVGAQESQEGALQRFNTQEMWRRISAVHGSLEASNDKLADVYDDWWRRWRVRPFTTLHQMATELSRTNPIKYAAVVAMVRDLEKAFVWRNVVIAEVNGTIMSAGLCGYYGEFKHTWPKDKERAYAVFFQKKFDFDPYDKKYGRLQFKPLRDRQAIETPLGRVWATGCLVWALGGNHEDDGGAQHSTDALVGDLVLWPPIRALAREEGLLK